jgi:hypothetical protein
MDTIFTPAEQIEILFDAFEVDKQLVAIQQRMATAGTVVPMRTLGHWEEMRLDQRDIVNGELKVARAVATQWDMSSY